MSDNTTRRRFVQLSGGAAALALAGCASDDATPSDEEMDGTTTGEGMDDGMTEEETDDEMTAEEMDNDGMDDTMGEPTMFTVRLENVAPTDFYGADTSTAGQVWITPGAFAVHTETNPIFTEDEPASIGLEALAEAGPPTGFDGEPGLVDELSEADNVISAGTYTPDNTVSDPNDPLGEVPGAPPIAPGGAFEFDIEAEPGQKLSFASMFVPSNDVFFSPDQAAISLFDSDDNPVDGDVTDTVELWDAGTEPNVEPPGEGPNQAPAQDSPNQGDDEGGVVRLLADVGDGYGYPDISDAIQVTLTPK
ncbi:MAG: spondin domain-containing protein [Haloarculaceae archaeon]